MTINLEKHITSDQPDISWRFDDKKEVLRKVRVLDKETENLIWGKLKGDFLIQDNELKRDKFDKFESIEFSDNYDAVTLRLKELFENSSTTDKVVLTWFSDGHSFVTDLETFISNWEDFFYPSSDDLVVVNENWDWIILIAHFESFQLGLGIKD